MKDAWEIREWFVELIKIMLDVKGNRFKGIGCTGQGYNNGTIVSGRINMSGRIKGVQAQILDRNHLAKYFTYTCASYTFHFAGVYAARQALK